MRPLLTGIGLAVVAMATAGNVEASDYCREYQRRVTIGGKIQDSYGTACMQPDGSWQTVSEGSPQLVGRTYPVAQPPVYYAQDDSSLYGDQLYVSRQVQYDLAPAYWGLNLSFNNRDNWRGHRGNYRDNHWHDRGRDRGRGHGNGHNNGGHGGHGGGRGRD